VQVERGTAAARLAAPLEAREHAVSVTDMKSGLVFLKRAPPGWVGAADPRRDGTVEAAVH
jgi:gamma-glutamyltranspeptidase / glutathione hydrolase